MDLQQSVGQFCSCHCLRLNKKLGQHFLIDQSILDTIVQAADIQPIDYVVEIGPGIGVLTKELLECARHVTAIEVDSRMPPLIEKYVTRNQKPKTSNHLTMIEGNALQVPMPSTPYKIVANIPYHITSPLLRHAFLESTVAPTSLTLLLQREVAEKICDQRDAGLLTILVGLFGVPQIVCHVPPESFLPPPAVDSSVIHIHCFPHPIAPPFVIDQVFRLAKTAFSQKRKMLRRSLAGITEALTRLKQAGIDPARRPQTLSIAEWIAFAERFC